MIYDTEFCIFLQPFYVIFLQYFILHLSHLGFITFGIYHVLDLSYFGFIIFWIYHILHSSDGSVQHRGAQFL